MFAILARRNMLARQEPGLAHRFANGARRFVLFAAPWRHAYTPFGLALVPLSIRFRFSTIFCHGVAGGGFLVRFFTVWGFIHAVASVVAAFVKLNGAQSLVFYSDKWPLRTNSARTK